MDESPFAWFLGGLLLKTKVNTELDREKWNIKTILSKQLMYSISEPIFYLRRGNTRREFIGT